MSGTTPITFQVTSNDVYGSDYGEVRSKLQITVEIFTLCLLWILSVLGNILVCLVIYRSRRIQSTTNYFVVSLACADLTMVLICFPFIATRVIANQWLVGEAMCKIVRFIGYVVPCANMYVFVSICIDRFYTIIYPLSFKVTRGTAKRMILCSWLSAIAVCSFTFYFFDLSVNTVTNTHFCPTYIYSESWSWITYTVFAFLCQFAVPLLMVTAGYGQVSKYIWRTGVSGRPIQRTTNPVPRTKVKMVKMLIVVTGTTVLMYTPFWVVQLWHCITQPLRIDPAVFIFALWTICATTVCKAIMYLCFNSNFRRGCKEVFCMSTMKCYRSNTYAITKASVMGRNNHVGVMENSSGFSRHNLESPSYVFNRTPHMEKTVWPLSSSTPTTYL